MRELKVLIVDDEIHAQNLLAGFIDGYKNRLKVMKKCATLLDAVEYIKTYPVDLMFLDVEMPIHSGTKINEFLTREERPDIIFVTAYDSFAIEAIRLGAFDYILKPIDRSLLFACLERYFDERKCDKEINNQQISISTHQGVIILNFNEIVFFVANGSYTEIICVNKKVIASKPIKFFEQKLPDSFIRVHRSNIINKDKVSGIVKGENNWWLSFKDSDVTIPVSRKYKGQLDAII